MTKFKVGEIIVHIVREKWIGLILNVEKNRYKVYWIKDHFKYSERDKVIIYASEIFDKYSYKL
jgi:hypothetical protein